MQIRSVGTCLPVETGIEFCLAGCQGCVRGLCGHSRVLWATGWGTHTAEGRTGGCWLWTRLGPSAPEGSAHWAHPVGGRSTEEHLRSPCQIQHWPRQSQKQTAAPMQHSKREPWRQLMWYVILKIQNEVVKWEVKLYKATWPQKMNLNDLDDSLTLILCQI